MGKRGPAPGSGRSGGPHVGILGGRPVSAATMLRRLESWRESLADSVPARWSIAELTRIDAELFAVSELIRTGISAKLSEAEQNEER